MDLHQIHMEDVCSLARTSLNVKVKGRGRQGQISCLLKMHCNALAANNVIQQQTGPFCRCSTVDGSSQRGCLWFVFAKTSLALVRIVTLSCVFYLP